MRFFRIIFTAALLVFLFSIAHAFWEKVDNLPLSDDGDKRSLLLMLDRQVRYLESLPNRTFRFGGMRVNRERLLATAKALRLVVIKHHGRPEFGLRIREQFNIFKVSNATKQGGTLFTGYYDPVLIVSRTRTEQYPFPVYGVPSDLKHSGGDRFYRVREGKMAPYYSRSQIDGQGVLAGRGLEIAWAKDYVSVFYLMVQGSGLVQFTDGEKATIHFAASNGLPFKSAARACMNAGKCPGGYAKNLAWFRAHPREALEFLYQNPRYIFFKIDKRPPYGVQNIPLTAFRTIATDKSYYPSGAIAFVKIPMPKVTKNSPISHRTVSLFVADGDTGSAIKGPGRADFYYGAGQNSEKMAGATYGWGEMYYILVK